MPVSRTTSDGKKSTIYVLVIFVVLFLAATVFAVVMYMTNEQLRNTAESAESRLAEIATGGEYNAVKHLVKGSGSSSVSVLKQITDEMRYTGMIVAGEDLSSIPLVGLRSYIVNRVDSALAKPADMGLIELAPDSGSADRLAGLKGLGLVGVVDMLTEEISAGRSDIDQLYGQMESQLRAHQQELGGLNEQIARLNEQLSAAAVAAATYEQRYAGLIASYTEKFDRQNKDLMAGIDQARNQEKATLQENEALKKILVDAQAKIKKLNDRLQQFQPKPDTEMAAIEPDGYIVSVVPRDRLAYINLARDDQIYRGLTFSVYDSYQEIPKSGQGKGSLVVIEIMDSISKCRITDYDPTNPIMEKDIVASLIWNRDKKYNFCVVGDFDFDGDGYIDPDGAGRINELITNWGSQPSGELTIDTDFLVVGQPPILPPRPADEFIDSNSEIARAYHAAQQRAELYRQTVAAAAALGVPTFNRERFMYFIGYYKQTGLALNSSPSGR